MRDLPESQSRLVPGSTLPTVVLATVVIAALYFGRDVFVPVALAVLLSFVLAPLVRFLGRCYVRRSVAVVIVAVLAFSAIIGMGALMVTQITELAGDLPRYQATLREKVQGVRSAVLGAGVLGRASEVLQSLRREIEPPNGESLPAPQGAPRDRPVPVEIREPDPSALETLATIAKPLIYPLTTAGVVVIFVIFILIRREDLRNRIVRLAGARDLQRTTAALDDAGERLSRLFLTQLVLNATFGVVIGLGLWIIGVPSAPLWGVLAMIMRFVPYVGALISAIFPLALAAAVGPGWTMAFMTAALFLVVEAIVGQVIEPLVYGQSAGLSPFAVLAAATFWTWLWGPIGLLLATPLTLCLVVLGRHVERFEFFEVILGDQPPLKPHELLYQRLLARDPVEVAEQARAYLEQKPSISYYDDILLKGLRLAQADMERDQLDEERMQRIRDGVAEIVDDLAAHEDRPESPPTEHAGGEAESPLAKLDKVATSQASRPLPDRWRVGKPVLCLPGLGILDEAAAIIIVSLLERQGIGARAEKAGVLSISQIFSWDAKDVALICLCYVGNATAAQVRYAVRRIRRKAPDVALVIALLGDAGRIEEQAISTDAVIVQGSLRATVSTIVHMAHRLPEAEDIGAGVDHADRERLVHPRN